MSSGKYWLGARGAGLALAFAGVTSLATAVITACGHADDDVGTNDAAETALDKADWLEKTARLLRNGAGLGPKDDVDALLAMSNDQVVDLFMKDPRFGDSVIAFNLYYLSRSIDHVSTPGPNGTVVYDRTVFDMPQVLASAKAVVSGGNYFDIYAASPPKLPRPRRAQQGPILFGVGEGDGGGGGVTPVNDREVAAKEFDAARDLLKQNTAASATAACQLFQNALFKATGRLASLGWDDAFNLESRWLGQADPAFPNILDCQTQPLDASRLGGPMAAIQKAFDTMFAMMEKDPVPPGGYKSVSEIPAYPSQFEGLPPIVDPWNFDFWSRIPSTSTNFHRKRAAYVLKTYFCDDLTPLSIPALADGGTQDERHASNPNCQACHYRLDPIGALFRNVGEGGNSGRGNRITFDDFVTFEGDRFQTYLDQWRNADGTFRAGKYVIGSDGKPTRDIAWLDSDGDTLNGLWSYLPRSETAKSCLVRRLSEFVLGPQQVYDREWLNQLARQARFKNGPTSGVGFKNLVKALVLSKTFSTQDPKPGVCYDAPTNAPANRPPCAVAHIIANQCADCHGSVQARGHIDFTQWTQQSDGTFSWPHEDDHGIALPRAESYKRIIERITETNPDKKMPFQRSLEAADLETLKTWLTQNLTPTANP